MTVYQVLCMSRNEKTEVRDYNNPGKFYRKTDDIIKKEVKQINRGRDVTIIYI